MDENFPSLPWAHMGTFQNISYNSLTRELVLDDLQVQNNASNLCRLNHLSFWALCSDKSVNKTCSPLYNGMQVFSGESSQVATWITNICQREHACVTDFVPPPN